MVNVMLYDIIWRCYFITWDLVLDGMTGITTICVLRYGTIRKKQIKVTG